jgi:hypothetical protein
LRLVGAVIAAICVKRKDVHLNVLIDIANLALIRIAYIKTIYAKMDISAHRAKKIA